MVGRHAHNIRTGRGYGMDFRISTRDARHDVCRRAPPTTRSGGYIAGTPIALAASAIIHLQPSGFTCIYFCTWRGLWPQPNDGPFPVGSCFARTLSASRRRENQRYVLNKYSAALRASANSAFNFDVNHPKPSAAVAATKYYCAFQSSAKCSRRPTDGKADPRMKKSPLSAGPPCHPWVLSGKVAHAAKI